MASRPLELVLARAEPDSAAALTCLTQAAKASWGYRTEFLAAWREELTVDAEFFRAHIAWTITLNGELAGWGAWVAWGRRCRLEHLWIAGQARGPAVSDLNAENIEGAIAARGKGERLAVGRPTESIDVGP